MNVYVVIDSAGNQVYTYSTLKDAKEYMHSQIEEQKQFIESTLSSLLNDNQKLSVVYEETIKEQMYIGNIAIYDKKLDIYRPIRDITINVTTLK